MATPPTDSNTETMWAIRWAILSLRASTTTGLFKSKDHTEKVSTRMWSICHRIRKSNLGPSGLTLNQMWDLSNYANWNNRSLTELVGFREFRQFQTSCPPPTQSEWRKLSIWIKVKKSLKSQSSQHWNKKGRIYWTSKELGLWTLKAVSVEWPDLRIINPIDNP